MQQLSALFFGSFGNSALRTTCVLFLALFAHRFARKGLHRLIQKNVLSHHSKALLTNLLSAFIFGLTTLIVLEQFGISVVPLVTAFGISGFALALGLTDTVSNFFAGMNLLATHVRH
jgi:small-conductance mechanosensitive channel